MISQPMVSSVSNRAADLGVASARPISARPLLVVR